MRPHYYSSDRINGRELGQPSTPLLHSTFHGREIERCTVGVTKVVFDTYLPAHSNSEVGQNEVSKLTSFRSNGGEKGREEFGH